MKRPVFLPVALVLAVVSAAPRAQSPREAELAQGLTRTVYVTVTDKAGSPVTDLTADDFVVKEGGKRRDVVAAAVTNVPLRIAIIVDDNGTGLFRYGVAKFIERLQGMAEFALSTINVQQMKLVDFTANGDDLAAAIGRLVARPAANDGGQLLEGIYDTAKDFQKRFARRPVIVALTVGGEEHSTVPAHHVLDELQKSGAALHVIAVNSSALRGTAVAQKPGALLEENMNLSEVLGDGSKQTGGSRGEIVASAGIVVGLQQLAEELRSQYAVSFSRTDSPKSNDKLNVSVKRAGLNVRAPMRLRRATQ
jgi:VWFA-related protein